jgi:hypothetical protein
MDVAASPQSSITASIFAQKSDDATDQAMSISENHGSFPNDSPSLPNQMIPQLKMTSICSTTRESCISGDEL